MIKLLVKLALAALVANAAWRVGSAYMTFYKFQDAVSEASQFSGQKSEDELHQRVIELATDYDVPLAYNAVTVRRENQHTYIDGTYERVLDLAPGYHYPWPFKLHVDTLSYESQGVPR
jgi:hypothetical protein